MRKHRGSLTISRPSYGDGRKSITISVKCQSSRQKFVTVEIDYENFAAAVTGLSEVECELGLLNLHLVGKTREERTIEFKMPEYDYDQRNQVAFEEASKTNEAGWLASNYFNSKDSFFAKDGQKWARTQSYRWVE